MKILIKESQLRNIILNEQVAGKKPTVAPKGDELRFWNSLSAHLESTYGYTIESDFKLTYDFDKLVTMAITWTPLNESKPMGNGLISMEIKFNDPSIVKNNAPHIANIQNLLRTKLINNTIITNKSERYLTQTIDKVANILFNVIKINGYTIANAPDDKIYDYGDYNTYQKTRKN
jgi:hypothetical protein